jgi:hypothetical protein
VSFEPATVGGFTAAVAHASSVTLSSYVLDRRNPIVRDLEAAADRGARVAVVLDGAPVGPSRAATHGIARTNAATVAELRAHGVDARLADGARAEQHLKAAIVDGRAFLDDRNWTATDDLVATSDPADVANVTAAIAGCPQSSGDLALTKAEAVAREASLIANDRGDRVDCASESFGATSVSVALAKRVASGAHVRLVVSERALRGGSPNERHALVRLATAGVELRAGPATDKLCITSSGTWLGSANATFSPPPPMLDWAVTTREPALAGRARATFERDWAASRPIGAAELAALSG